MRNSKPIMMLIVSAAVGLIATGAAAKYMSGNEGGPADPARNEPATKWVTVATEQLKAGKEIVATDIRKEERIIQELAEDAMEKSDLVVGRSVKVTIEKDAVVTESMLEPLEERICVDEVVRPGYRAMQITLDHKANDGNLLSAGRRVDVIVVFDPAYEGAKQMSRTILENINVLSVTHPKDNGRRAAGGPAVVLEVLPKEAEKLALAMTSGSIVLTARMVQDAKLIESEGTTMLYERSEPEEVVVEEAPPLPQPPTPDELLTQARVFIAEGNQDAGEALLRRIAAEYPGEDAGEGAQQLLADIAARRLSEATSECFGEDYESIKELLAAGDFENFDMACTEALASYEGFVAADGTDAEEALRSLCESAVAKEKDAKRLYSFARNFLLSGKAEKADKYIQDLESRYPMSQYCQMAKSEREKLK